MLRTTTICAQFKNFLTLEVLRELWNNLEWNFWHFFDNLICNSVLPLFIVVAYLLVVFFSKAGSKL